MNRVHIIDYGIGNIYSVARAVEKVGAEARLTDDPAEIAAADRLILPGVGAFGKGMAGLAERNLDEAVLAFARTGRPLLGICLGMQMLAGESAEFGTHRGLGLIPGQVMPISSKGSDGAPRKVPFIGWAMLEPRYTGGYGGTPLAGVGRDEAFYFVHSFHFLPENEADLVAIYHYDSAPIVAAVARNNIFGCQFHPEKSGPAGLRVIANFLAS